MNGFAVAAFIISLVCIALALCCWYLMSFIESIFGCACSDELDDDNDILVEDENDVE